MTPAVFALRAPCVSVSCLLVYHKAVILTTIILRAQRLFFLTWLVFPTASAFMRGICAFPKEGFGVIYYKNAHAARPCIPPYAVQKTIWNSLTESVKRFRNIDLQYYYTLHNPFFKDFNKNFRNFSFNSQAGRLYIFPIIVYTILNYNIL